MKLRELQRKIQQLKAYEDNKFLKDKERTRVIETLDYLKKQKEAIIFKSIIENMMEVKTR